MLDAPVQRDSGRIVLDEVRGEINFENVHVRYPGSDLEALKGIDLHIRAGEHVAFIGHSGSGKTTTVNLLPRFVEVSKGCVRIDGIDLRDCTLESLRNQMAVVSQDVFLFDATVRENIAYGYPDATPDDIDAAAKAAALADVLSGLPHGLDTAVGEGGRLLSGGQRQRISIARAFLKMPPLSFLTKPQALLTATPSSKLSWLLSI